MGFKDGIYQDVTEPFRDAALPDHLKESVLEVFNQANDKSLFSLDIETLSNRRELKSLFSSSQYRFLQACDLNSINTVLDLSQDLGGISHFIADQVTRLESIKIDPALAQLSANRCANKHNVCHVSADLDKLDYPTNYYDLIVIGQLEALELESQALMTLLGTLQASLNDDGVLLVSANNSDQLNKWFNSKSNDSSEPLGFADLYKPKGNSALVNELERKQLRDMLLACNFASIDVHASFSQSDQYKVLFSEDYLTSAVNGLNHFHQLGTIENPEITEFLLYQRLIDEKQNLVDVANRFVVLAGASSSAVRNVYDSDFYHYPNPEVKPELQTATRRSRAAHFVDRHAAYPNSINQSGQITDAATARRFYKGHLLVGDWLNALLKKDHRRFENLIQEYDDWLNSEVITQQMSNKCFNISPANIVISERGGQREYQQIGGDLSLGDKLEAEISADFLLFRALFWFAQNNKSLLTSYASANDIYSIALFIVEHMPNIFQVEELEPFADLEQQIHNETYSSPKLESIRLSLGESLLDKKFVVDEVLQTKPKKVLEETVRSLNQSLVGQSHRLKQLRLDNEHQTQRIADLLNHRAEAIELLKEQEEDAEDLEFKLRDEIDHLHERLHEQHQRNDELHGYLLMRPGTRAKRVARRTLSRITGKPMPSVEVQAEPEIIQPVEEPPLPTGELIGQNTEDYQLWISENTLGESGVEAAKKEIDAMALKPVFSILVPIYNTDPQYLLPMIESVQNQIYPYWQLCLVDDCSPKSYLKRILEHEALQDERISIQLNDVNQGISVTTNDALAMAKGDYIALLDHDDEITIDALYENAKVINATPDAGLIFSDEDKLNMKGVRVEPYFKPDYSPDLLHTNNYICHFTVIKKSIVQELGGFREGLDGSQDHDVIIRSAAAAKRVVHIPKILYHWRKIPGSTAVTYDSKSYAWEAGRKAVEDQLQKDESGVRVEFGTLKGTYRVFREIKGEPLVSIIVPFKDKPGLLESCLDSVLNRSSYRNFEIIGVSNNSEHALTFEIMARYTELDDRIRFVKKDIPFNFSAICNYGVEQANGDYLVLLNNDIEIISPDWIERLLEHAQRDEIGAVGGKLLFPDGTIQHAGIVAGMVGAAGHPHKFFPDNHIGYHGRLHMVNNVSAVTGAMMMMKADKFREVGGLDEENLAVAYNDVDLCLKLLSKGYRNVFTPHSKATHHESISRGYEDTDEKLQRLLKEQTHFLSTWAEFLEAGDPYYNPNLSLKNERFSLNFKD